MIDGKQTINDVISATRGANPLLMAALYSCVNVPGTIDEALTQIAALDSDDRHTVVDYMQSLSLRLKLILKNLP
jgi:hypothetical protein